MRAFLLRPALGGVDLEAARSLAAAVDADGAWVDRDDTQAHPPIANTTRHLERVLTLARARPSCAGELDAALARAFDHWLSRDIPGENWWQQQIGIPRLVGTVAFLLGEGLSAGARGKVIEILARSRWSQWNGGAWRDRSGTDLLQVAGNVLLRGCIEDVPGLCQDACNRAYGEVRVAQGEADGLQADMSFRAACAPPRPGRDGLAFAESAARFFLLTHGTPWQAPADCLRLFAAFLLDGQQWLIRAGAFDHGAANGGNTGEPNALPEFAVVVEQLADGGVTPRRAEMAAFARRLRGATEMPLHGHRHYWRLDLAVHQRPAFYTSVRMNSRRTAVAGGEPSRPSEDGLTFILRDGEEYRDIQPVWDRRRLPGTTAVQSAALPPPGHGNGGNFVGGVSDGEYGIAVLDLRRDGLRARKAWFYFDDSFVCLGNGIACDDPAGPVFTSINQCALRGPVVAYGKGGENHVLAAGRSYDLSAAYRVEHDGITYHFPEGMAVRARLAPQTGGGPDAGVAAREVFSLWIDHGTQPGGGEAYAYTVLPAAGGGEARGAVDHEISQVKILANTPTLQAVCHQALRLVGIVFWESGIITVPYGGRVAVNRPCVVLCQDRRPDGMRLSIANPANTAATIHAEYANRCLCFELPGGLQGGQGVTRVL